MGWTNEIAYEELLRYRNLNICQCYYHLKHILRVDSKARDEYLQRNFFLSRKRIWEIVNETKDSQEEISKEYHSEALKFLTAQKTLF